MVRAVIAGVSSTIGTVYADRMGLKQTSKRN
jgi:hypothetical protein